MQKANEDKIIRLINAGVREVKGDRATPLTRALGTMLVAVCVAMASSSPAVRIRRHLMKRQLRSYCYTTCYESLWVLIFWNGFAIEDTGRAS
jgi:hypothetical protein